MIKNKRGWLRIVEASIAVLLVASVILIMISRMPREDKTESVHELQRHILRQVSSNETLRGEILQSQNQYDKTEAFIQENLPVYYNFTIRICEVEEVCGMPFYIEREVYADEILITANLTNYSPKKLKFFVWGK